MYNHIFNSITQEQYNQLKEEDKLNDDNLYFTDKIEEDNTEDNKVEEDK